MLHICIARGSISTSVKCFEMLLLFRVSTGLGMPHAKCDRVDAKVTTVTDFSAVLQRPMDQPSQSSATANSERSLQARSGAPLTMLSIHPVRMHAAKYPSEALA